MTDRNRVPTVPHTPHGLDADDNPEACGSTDNAIHVFNIARLSGEDTTLDRTWGGPLAKKVSLTADGQVGIAGPCVYYGYLVTTALSAAAVNVRDAASAGTGDIVDIIAASAAIGVQNRLPAGIYCPAGVYADFGGTGTVTFFYQQ
jgi:hypothetical protein